MKLADSSTILVAGAGGMVGKAICRALENAGHTRVLKPRHAELDLCHQAETGSYVARHRPDIVIAAAAKVGGIHANQTYPAEFIYENLAIAVNLIHAAHEAGVERLLFLGSSCIYPREAPQPMPEECLLTSALEPSNEPYAIAKIAGLKLCQAYRRQYGKLYHSVMPTNLYGPGDNYHPENSHVIPGLMRRFHEAKERGDAEVTVWGTGRARREFLHADDLAKACLHVLDLEDPPDWINIGSGTDLPIAELAELVKRAVGFQGKIVFDTSKPDGTPRKILDCARLQASGWKPGISLEEGLHHTYETFLEETRAQRVRA